MTAPAVPPAAVAEATAAAAGVTGLAAQAVALQAVMADLGLVTVQQLSNLFQQYAKAPDFPAVLRQAYPAIVTPHAHAAALITAQWYDELDPGSSFTAKPVVDIPPEQIDKTLGWALHAPTAPKAPSELEPVELDQPPDTTPTADDTLGRLAGSASRMVTDASRDTVLQNVKEEGVKWARYASPGACAFCRLLATRGPVYHSQESALKSHDHCRCVAAPLRGDTEWDPPDYMKTWEKQYTAARKQVGRDGKQKTATNILSAMRKADPTAH